MNVRAFISLLRRPLAELPHELAMVPVPGAFDVEVKPPGSKSLTNRALLLAALGEGESVISGALLDADDARVMMAALERLGVKIEGAESGVLRVTGVGGRLRGGCTVNLKNAGTATRFLTAAVCLADAPVVIDGNERMRQRPIGELVAMLRRLGVRVDEMGEPGCVPLRVHPGVFEAEEIEIGLTHSSQFISALMLVAPFMPRGLMLKFGGEITSATYLEMSERLLVMKGMVPVSGKIEAGGELHVPRHRVMGFVYEVEPDASGMTYFWGAAAIVAGARVRSAGLGKSSLQGDARFAELLLNGIAGGRVGEHEGSIEGFESLGLVHEDMSLMPDAAMTLAAVACFASEEGTSEILGLRTLRVKETDRLAAMKNELSKIGVRAEVFEIWSGAGVADEGIRITAPRGGVDCSPNAAPVVFDTYDDHRMAMSLALIGLKRPNVVIREPQCVAKTYPGFWRDLAGIYEDAADRAGV